MGETHGPIATRVIYEDDEVRVWDQRIEAGATLGRHRHEHDYAIVNVRGDGPMDVEFHDGSGGSLGEALRIPKLGRGEVFFIRRGHDETAHNHGDEYRAILVELKRGADED